MTKAKAMRKRRLVAIYTQRAITQFGGSFISMSWFTIHNTGAISPWCGARSIRSAITSL